MRATSAQIVHLCLQKDGLGYPGLQRGERHHHRRPADRGVPGEMVPRRAGHAGARQGFEAPLSNRKAREVLGFKEQHNWRDEIAKP